MPDIDSCIVFVHAGPVEMARFDALIPIVIMASVWDHELRHCTRTDKRISKDNPSS